MVKYLVLNRSFEYLLFLRYYFNPNSIETNSKRLFRIDERKF